MAIEEYRQRVSYNNNMRKEIMKQGIHQARQFHHQNNWTARSELKVKKN